MKKTQEMARKLPSSEPIECEVLSALLFGHKRSALAFECLKPEHFETAKFQMIFTSAKSLFDRGKPVDVVSVSDSMDRADLESVGGLRGLSEITSGMYSAYDLENACKILREKARQRLLIKLLERAQEEVWEQDADVDEVLDRCITDMNEIATENSTDDANDFDSGLEMLAGLRDPQRIRIFCGVTKVDELVGGFRPGELIVLTAETGTGKTLLASQIKRRSCADDHHSLFCNGEMLAPHLRAREVSVQARVPYGKFRKPEEISEREFEVITRVVGDGCTKCRIMDGDLTLAKIRWRARKYRMKSELDLLIVDYDELVEAPGKDEFAEQREVIRGLKSLALELKIPVLLVSQLRKALQNEDRTKPTLSRLYGSGSKVKTASTILYVDRPFVRELEGDETEARIVIVKNRDGKVGSVNCRFNVGRLEFEDLPSDHPESERLDWNG